MSPEPPTGNPFSGVSERVSRLGSVARIFLEWNVSVHGRLVFTGPELLVSFLSGVVNLVVLAGGSALYFPDSANYVLSAYSMFLDGNFHVGFARTPGYSLFLSPIVGLAGAHAMIAMMTVQHALVVLLSIGVVKIGDQLDRSKALGLVAGVLSAFSLQLAAYANLPMSEVLYAALATWGLLFALRYVRQDHVDQLIAAMVLFSAATVVRPAGQFLAFVLIGFATLRLFIPALLPDASPGTGNGPKRVKAVASAATVCFTIVTPWIFFNYAHYGFFGLGGNPGLNLYSNTVEYGDFQDGNSPAIADIRRQWEVSEAKSVARGETPEPLSTWRNHWASMTHYMDATGLPMWKADKVFLKAAVDAIKAHPEAYVRHVLENIYRNLVYAEPAYLYLPGLRDGEKGAGFMRYALPVSNLEGPRRNLADAVDRRGLLEVNPIRFNEPTVLTPVYGFLAFAYHSVQLHGTRLLAVFAAGFALAVWNGFRPGGMLWWVVLAYVAYLAFVPMLVVPASPRHRLPADPAIALLYGTFIVFVIRAGWRIVRRTAELAMERK